MVVTLKYGSSTGRQELSSHKRLRLHLSILGLPGFIPMEQLVLTTKSSNTKENTWSAIETRRYLVLNPIKTSKDTTLNSKERIPTYLLKDGRLCILTRKDHNRKKE